MGKKGKELREKKRKEARYYFTMGDIEAMVKEEVNKREAEIYQECMAEATRQAVIILFGLPLKVLMEHFWQKSYLKKFPKFCNLLMEYYDKWGSSEPGYDTEELRDYIWEVGGVKFEPKDE